MEERINGNFWLESASEHDLLLAAEAVVDAAICCRESRGDSPVSVDEIHRLFLIDALHRDPSLTQELFNGFLGLES